MAEYLRPGVFVQESLTANPPASGSNATSVAAFIGYTDRGPSTPTLVTSWSQYVSYYGGWGSNNTMHLAVLLFFSNGGAQAWILRVPAATAALATRSFNDRNASPASTLQFTAANPGAWGNGINVTIATSASGSTVDLLVYFGGTTDANIVERYTDLSMTATDDRYIPKIINQNSKYLAAVDLGSSSTGTTRLPVAVANAYLASGSDGSSQPASTDIAAAISLFDTVKSSLILNAPGVVDATSVNLITTYASTRGDVFVVIDPVPAATAAAQITRANAYTATSYGAVYYPQIVINDPTTNTPGLTLTVNPGGAVVGNYVATDASRGVFKAPAGLGNRVGGAVSVQTLSNSDLDSLNSNAAAVNAIKYVPGAGIVIMGSRTLQSTYVSKYVPVRRSLIYLEKTMTELSQFAIFEPNDAKLWRSITATLSGFLNDFWRQGGLRGNVPTDAYYVKCDSDINNLSTINNGIVNIEVGVALQRPAEFIVIKIGQFDGGTTVTTA